MKRNLLALALLVASQPSYAEVDPIARGLAARVKYQTTTGTAIGAGAGASKGSTGSDDVFIGYNAGALVPDGQSFITVVGAYAADAATSGAGGTVIGQKALTNATSIQSSVAVGSKAGDALPSANLDVLVGYGAASAANATNLGRRVYVGYGAGAYDNGDYNVYLGYNAGKQSSVNTTATQQHIGIGAFTLQAVSGGIANIAVGYEAGKVITSASGNVLIGHQAGVATTGGSNVMLGYNAGTANTTGSYNILLGESAGNSKPVGTSNTFIAGSSSSGTAGRIDNVFFGQGYSAAAPTAYTINGTGGSGTDIAGADVKIAGGKGTGSGAGGSVVIQVAAPSGSSSTLNTLTDAVTVRASDSRADFAGPIQFTPGTSVTPQNNGDVVIEATSNTTLTFKLKGSDGTVRTATLTLS